MTYPKAPFYRLRVRMRDAAEIAALIRGVPKSVPNQFAFGGSGTFLNIIFNGGDHPNALDPNSDNVLLCNLSDDSFHSIKALAEHRGQEPIELLRDIYRRARANYAQQMPNQRLPEPTVPENTNVH